AGQQPVECGECGAMVTRELERRGHQDQLRTLGEERAANAMDRLVQMVLESAVGQIQVIAAGETQQLADPGPLLSPPPAVGFDILDLLATATAVREKKHPNRGSSRRELGQQPAAAEHLVVVVGSDHEDALGAHALGPSGRLQSSVHCAYPRACNRFAVSGL